MREGRPALPDKGDLFVNVRGSSFGKAADLVEAASIRPGRGALGEILRWVIRGSRLLVWFAVFQGVLAPLLRLGLQRAKAAPLQAVGVQSRRGI